MNEEQYSRNIIVSINGIKYLLLVLYILFVFFNNHSALFIADYCLPLLLFILLGTIEKIEKKDLTFSKYSVSIFLLCTILLITSFFNLNIIDRGTLISYVVWFLFVIVAFCDMPKQKTIDKLMNSFILSSFIISIIIIVCKHEYLHPGYNRFTIQIGNNVEIDPNYLSAFMMIGLVFSLYWIGLSSNENKGWKLLHLISALTIAYAILLTGSRATFLGIIICLMGFALQVLSQKKASYKLFILILLPLALISVVLLVQIFLPDDLLSRFEVNSLADSSNSRRIQHWISAIECILKRPVFGYGAAHTKDILQIFSGHIGDAHNTLLTLLLHFGVVGTTIFLYILFSICKKIFCSKKPFWISFFIGFLFINLIIANHLGISFWLVIVMLYYIGNSNIIQEDIFLEIEECLKE